MPAHNSHVLHAMKPSPAVSLLLTNLRLLDYYGANGDGSDSHSHSHSDPRSDSKSDSGVFPITPAVFTSLTNKGKAFEHIIYHLFHTFDPDECALVFLSPFVALRGGGRRKGG